MELEDQRRHQELILQEKMLEEELRRQEFIIMHEKEQAILQQKAEIAKEYEDAAFYHEHMANTMRRHGSTARRQEMSVITPRTYSPRRWRMPEVQCMAVNHSFTQNGGGVPSGVPAGLGKRKREREAYSQHDPDQSVLQDFLNANPDEKFYK